MKKDPYYHWNIDPETRKHHYWRGFRAALFITVPIIVFFMICINALL